MIFIEQLPIKISVSKQIRNNLMLTYNIKRYVLKVPTNIELQMKPISILNNLRSQLSGWLGV